MKNISGVKSACVGCFACKSICKINAIESISDNEGFLYPFVDNNKCINCGACAKVCPALSEHTLDSTRSTCYYGASPDEKVVENSSSGGAFTCICQPILEAGGIVYGAVFDEKKKSIVYSDTDSFPLNAIRKSKYVASDIQDTFLRVSGQLKSGRDVIFCGLPCHVDGLRLFLSNNPNIQKLITVDFICGGTASPLFFKKFLEGLELKYGGRVTFVDFRAKLYGWKEHSIKVLFDNKKAYKNYAMFDPFFKGYFEKTYQRDSCYQCKYRLQHYSDIIIADYWGGLQRNIENDKGLSMVISNSEKGRLFLKSIFTDINSGFKVMPTENSEYAFKTEKERYDNAFKKKSEFYECYVQYGFIKATKIMYMKHARWNRIKKELSRIKIIIRGNCFEKANKSRSNNRIY